MQMPESIVFTPFTQQTLVKNNSLTNKFNTKL